jgi:hypothetical protein
MAMTKNDYMDLINVEVPGIYDVVTMNVICPTMKDVVEYVAIELYTLGITDTPLAKETRKQLTSLRDKGVLSFDNQ